MVNVTKTFLPPIKEYERFLEQIWNSSHVTNHGPLVEQLENRLKEFLGAKHLFFVSNGTIALQIAIKALDLRGEIITTPFSYVATTSSLVWEGCKPVFTDIDPLSLNIDCSRIEQNISESTSAILATHVFGNPCQVEQIEEISKKYNVPVIYDAAHAFGVNLDGESILNFGDISTLSFHATKLFHTVEGGALVTENDELAHKISYLRNFGHNGAEEFWGLGINGKNSELHAAMGLSILPHFKSIVESRRRAVELYDHFLYFRNVKKPIWDQRANMNYSYYPVQFKSESTLLKAMEVMNLNQIYPRRYFFPSLNKLPYVEYKKMDVAEEVANTILCLPLYSGIKEDIINRISKIVNELC